MINASLVLEGGGMKGLFTAGVLDFFQSKGLEFESIYAVSAGACQMSSFLSKQPGRGRDVMIDYLDDPRYMGFKSYIKTGDVFGADFNYKLVPQKLNPIDWDMINSYEGNAYVVVTNIETGLPEYKRMNDIRKDFVYIRASSSLPLVSRTVHIKGQPYLDGGMSDSIPIKKSIADGNKKNIVVLTKPDGYRKHKETGLGLMKVRYRKYPKAYELMKNRHNMYNETIEFVENESKAGNLFLIQPQTHLHIERLESDKNKLLKLYEDGYSTAERLYDDMMKYLNS